MVALVERKLGTAASRLYDEIAGLIDLLVSVDRKEQPTRTALARVGLRALCGEYHDYRAGHPCPKGDLVEALRAVPQHAVIDHRISQLVRRVVAGEFSDGEGEGRRWVAQILPARADGEEHAEIQPARVELTPREYRVFVWLYRYVEVYGRSPLLREVAVGLETSTIAVHDVLRALQRRGAAVNVGGHRGWIPVRAP